MPDEEAFEALQAEIAESLEAYIVVAEFDAETVEALEVEIERTAEAQRSTRERVAAGGMTEMERRAFLQSERMRIMQNIRDILGTEEASIFLDEVLGVPVQAQQRMEQRLLGQDKDQE